MNGTVRNYSSSELWIIEYSAEIPKAHLLKPGKQTPSGVDIMGFPIAALARSPSPPVASRISSKTALASGSLPSLLSESPTEETRTCGDASPFFLVHWNSPSNYAATLT
jgi:hypothetical protein